MQASNMLSAKKVKIHGMISRRWLTADKITQYKGLVKLHNRDKKIAEVDTVQTKKKLRKDVINLYKEISEQRNELVNAIKGDKQRLRNTLAEHKSMQLAFQMLPASTVVDKLFQENFNKQKELDRLNFKMQQKTQRLINLKLELSVLQDRIKYETVGKIPIEETAETITVKVQDALLKKEAAEAVRDTYKKIIDILRKDAIYFDAVLNALHVDGYNQGKCIYRVTEMGQLATEYLDDRQLEYRILEKEIMRSMKERNRSIVEIKLKLADITNSVRYLIRRDSVIDLNDGPVTRSSETILLGEIEEIEGTLNFLRDTTLVAKIEDIFPQMQVQKHQKLRLQDLVRKNTKNRDTLLKKSKHAEEMFNSFNHSMVETTFWYKEQKVHINKKKEEFIKKRRKHEKLINHRGDLFMKIRTNLQHMTEIIRTISTNREAIRAISRRAPRKMSRSADFEDPMVIVKPEYVEEEAPKLLYLITDKLTTLMTIIGSYEFDEEKKLEAENMFLKFVTDMTGKALIMDTGKMQESLLGDLRMDDPTVPSRLEIKEISARICEKYAKTEFDI